MSRWITVGLVLLTGLAGTALAGEPGLGTAGLGPEPGRTDGPEGSEYGKGGYRYYRTGGAFFVEGLLGAAAVHFVLEHPDISGAVNFCAPAPVLNRDLAAALGKALNRPAFMPAPAFLVRMVLGEFAEVLLGSQRAIPQKLQEHRFAFHYPDIEAALQAVVRAAAG